LAASALIRQLLLPLPLLLLLLLLLLLRQIVGDLSRSERVLVGLDVRPR
jgi:hypothetical protein